MSSSKASGSSASGQPEIDDVEALMKELGLREEDLDDVVFDEKEASSEVTRWMVIARVHMDKPYSQAWFFQNMRSAWNLARDVKFRPSEENLYTLRFFCLWDWRGLKK